MHSLFLVFIIKKINLSFVCTIISCPYIVQINVSNIQQKLIFLWKDCAVLKLHTKQGKLRDQKVLKLAAVVKDNNAICNLRHF